MRMFNIWDSVANQWSARPEMFDTKGDAISAFRRAVNDNSENRSDFARYPHNYCLYEIGFYDRESGLCVMHEKMVCIGLGVEFLDKKMEAVNA